MQARTLVALAVSTLAVLHPRQEPAAAADELEGQVDLLMEQALERRRIPGAAIVVRRAGETVLAKGYGIANLEHGIPVEPETIFQSGSTGKQFTAALALLLVEDGELALDAPVSEYLPDAPESWKPITLRHLLSHTAGLGDYTPDFDMRRDYTESELLARIYATPLAFAPGERWSYSNLGYVTIGILIGRVTGRFYGDLLEERIFQPLGMATARVISESELVANRAAGYVLRDGELCNQEWVSPTLNTTADGALYFSVLDLARWDAGLDGEDILSRSSLDALWTPARLNDGTSAGYGFGWRIGDRNGHRIVEHGGAWQGFTAHIARFPDDRLTVVVLTNLAGADPGGIAHRIAGLVVSELAPVQGR